jgi:hypothetical protein
VWQSWGADEWQDHKLHAEASEALVVHLTKRLDEQQQQQQQQQAAAATKMQEITDLLANTQV